MTPILGKSVATAEQMAAYLLSKNPNPKINMDVTAFCRLYLYIGALEGVRGDLEFARTCHETGNLAFTGVVVPEQNNYCGHGTVNSDTPGSYFPDEATGILVQIQHAKAYATAEPLNYTCLDDRYKYVQLGSAPTMEEMSGKWAVPGYDTKKYASLEDANKANDSYGHKIVKILNDILGVKEENPVAPVPDELPLKGKIICIDAGHYGTYNKCPAIPEYSEAKTMWKLHLMQKSYLEQLGATVIITREDQKKDLSLHSRGVASKGCHLFISDHTNAVGNGMNENVDYVAVYHLVDDDTTSCDDISKEIAQKLAPVISDVIGTTQGYKILTRLSSSDKNGDGKFNDNYYGVLNGARSVNVPGLILEHSFHTNTKIVSWLLNDDNLDKLARAEAKAIAEYFSNQDIIIDADVKGNVPYTIKVANVSADDVLYIRKEPNANSEETGSLAYNDPRKYTIIEERNGWGRLKSRIGWINLKYTVRA